MHPSICLSIQSSNTVLLVSQPMISSTAKATGLVVQLTRELTSPTVQLLSVAKLVVLYMSNVNLVTAWEAMLPCCATGLVMPAEHCDTYKQHKFMKDSPIAIGVGMGTVCVWFSVWVGCVWVRVRMWVWVWVAVWVWVWGVVVGVCEFGCGWVWV